MSCSHGYVSFHRFGGTVLNRYVGETAQGEKKEKSVNVICGKKKKMSKYVSNIANCEYLIIQYLVQFTFKLYDYVH